MRAIAVSWIAACVIGVAAWLAVQDAQAAASRTDDKFVEYYIEPCVVGPAALLAPPYNWSVQEVVDYNVICTSVFSGGFTSADNYAASSSIGSINAQAASTEALAKEQVKSVQDRLDELQAEENPQNGWGLLLSLQGGGTERDATENELGYDSELQGVVVGFDYRHNDTLVTGFALGVTQDEADYDDNGGTLKTDSYSLLGYFTYLVGAGGYVNGYVGYSPIKYDNERNFAIDGAPGDNFNVNGTVNADFDGEQYLAGVSGGYDWYHGDASVGVFGSFDYSETVADAYDEEGDTGFELEYPEQTSRSATYSLGVIGTYNVDMGWGALVPSASLAAVHEAKLDGREFEAKLALIPDDHPTKFFLETDDPDRDYAIATLGAVIAMNSGTQYFVTYEKLLEHDFFDTWSLTAGALLEF